MTAASETWTLASAADAARVRAVLARLTADAGVPALDRARFLGALGARLRHGLDAGGTEVAVAAGADGELRVAVDGPEPWRHTLRCPAPVPGPLPRPDEVSLAEALLEADEDTAALLTSLTETEELLGFHRGQPDRPGWSRGRRPRSPVH
ncbi:hypothetical protein AB0N19_35005, partial [Streptomyces sp. NPDC051132]